MKYDIGHKGSSTGLKGTGFSTEQVGNALGGNNAVRVLTAAELTGQGQRFCGHQTSEHTTASLVPSECVREYTPSVSVVPGVKLYLRFRNGFLGRNSCDILHMKKRIR